MFEQFGRLERVQFAAAEATSADTVHEAAGYKRNYFVCVLEARTSVLFTVAKRVRAYIDECARFTAAALDCERASAERKPKAANEWWS